MHYIMLINISKHRQTTFRVSRSRHYTVTGPSSGHEFLLLHNSGARSSGCGQSVKAGRKKTHFCCVSNCCKKKKKKFPNNTLQNYSACDRYNLFYWKAKNKYLLTWGDNRCHAHLNQHNYFYALINSFVSINICTTLLVSVLFILHSGENLSVY